jgi:hypothetical protein
MNHRKFRRLYREARLQVRRRGGRKRALGTRAPLTIPQGPNLALEPRLSVGFFRRWSALPHSRGRRRLYPRMPGTGRRHVLTRLACRARARGDRRTAWSSDDKMMREFIAWRRDYYANFDKLPKNAKRYPTDKTLQWDIMLGKAIVKWAAEQGLRGKQPAITVTFTPKKKRGALRLSAGSIVCLGGHYVSASRRQGTSAPGQAENCCGFMCWCWPTLSSGPVRLQLKLTGTMSGRSNWNWHG